MNRDHHSQRGQSPAFSVLTLACLAMMSTSAWSLGVGRPQTASSLGQPLNLLFPVQVAPGEVVTADCIRAEVTAGDVSVPPSALRWQLESDGLQLRGVRLRSTQAIDEPLVNVTLSLGCPVRLTRQYTAFIDPPGHSLEPLADPGSSELPAPSPVFQITSNDAPKPAAAPKRDAASRPVPALIDAEAASAPRAAASAPQRPRRQARKPVETTKAPAQASARPPAGGSRLALDPADALPVPPSAALLAAEAAASAASAVEQAQQQLAAMQQKVNEMTAEQRRTQAALQALRQELQAARENNQPNYSPWLLGLTVLSVALAASTLLLWRGRQQQRKEAGQTWWGEPTADLTPPPPAPEAPTVRMTYPAGHPGAAAAAPVSPPAAAPAPSTATAAALAASLPPERPDPRQSQGPTTMPMPLSITDPERTMQLPPRTPIGPPGRNGRPSATAAADDALDALASLEAMEPLSLELRQPGGGDTRPTPLLSELNGHGAVTVEELIDLEQQVDFFMVLGQDDAAIELLSSRLGERDAASGLPYLKLMELYQRRGDKNSFERVAQRFGKQFRARPPAWSEDLNDGTGLESHPELVERLESAWADPSGSMSLLQDLFSHHQEYSGDLGLPAYRELLLLYAVARDRAEHELRAQDIDVFLPLDATAPADMMATMTFQAPGAPPTQRPGVEHSLDLDLSLTDDDDGKPKPPKAY